MWLPLSWSVFISTSLLALPFILLWRIKRRRQHGIFRRHGIAGPKPDLYWGNWMQLKKDRIKVMDQWIKTYGKVFGIFMAEKPYLVITDVDIVRQIFLKEANQFQDRSEFALDVEPLTSSLMLLRGEDWKKVRKVLNAGFTIGKVKLLSKNVTTSANRLLKVLYGYHLRNEPFDSFAVTQGFFMDVIAKSALSWEVNCQREHAQDPLLTDAKKIFEDFDKATIQTALTLPVLRTVFKWLFPYTVSGRILKRFADNVRTTIAHRRQRAASGARAESDLLQLLLDAQAATDKETSTISKNVFTLKDCHVISNSVLLLLSGIETTASTLSFALYFLAAQPQQQAAVHNELQGVITNGKDVSFDELENLKHLDMVVREALRLFPAVPLMVVRVCDRDTNVMGQFIPAGVNILVPAWHIQRDPQLWPEPSKFLPERFLEDPTERNPVTFLPFGLGPRTCLAKRLALFELKTAIFKILAAYEITLSDTTKLPVRAVVPDVILRPENPIMLNLRARETIKL